MNEAVLAEATRLEDTERNYEAAISLMQDLIRQDPTCTEAYVHLAADSGMLGRFQQAEQYARRGLDIDPYSGRACYYLACALRSQDRLAEAYPLMQKALALVKAQAAKGTLAEASGMDLPLVGWNQNVERDAKALEFYMRLHPSRGHPSKVEAAAVSAVPKGMKAYQDVRHGFELIIQNNWFPAGAYKILSSISSRISGIGRDKDTYQLNCRNEAFNFVIGPLSPEPTLGVTQYQFMVYAQGMKYTNLEFGRIRVAGKEHVWARYHIHDRMGERWNKKYMIVMGGTEYSITGTCNTSDWFAKREQDWDAIAASFRLLSYEDAHRAVAVGQLKKARLILERCIQENPDHLAAHKDLADVMLGMGDTNAVIRHRNEVKRLDPSDLTNRYELTKIHADLWHRDDALREANEVLRLEPNNPVYQNLARKMQKGQMPATRSYFYFFVIMLLGMDIFLLRGRALFWIAVCNMLFMLFAAIGVWMMGSRAGMTYRKSALLAIALFFISLFLLYNKGL